MKIEFLTLEKYLELRLNPSSAFGSADFLRLNAYKADNVICAVGDGKVGIVFGKTDGELRAPWSAPYMSVDRAPHADSAELFREFGDSLRSVLDDNIAIRLVTPPKIHGRYEEHFLKGFRREGDKLISDTSFYIDLRDSEGEKRWNKSAKRNLRRANNEGIEAFITSDFRECYDLIASHHVALGYNMAMTAEQVYDTSRIIPVDFWVVKKNDELLAAMYCYRVRNDIVQVISSGDTPNGRKMGAGMFMERAIIDHYRKLLVEKEGIINAILDHGPTSVNGIQNEGLASFKSSFGCKMTPKTTLISSGESVDNSGDL